MRVATWNVNCFNPNRAEDKLRLLVLEAWDVALLQEVDARTFSVFTTPAEISGVHSVDLLGGPWGARAHGTAVLVRGNAAIETSWLIPIELGESAPGEWLQARLMGAAIDVGGRRVVVASFHAPNAAGEGPERERKIAEKMRLFRSLERWCVDAGEPLVVGMDANSWSDSITALEFDATGPFADEHRFVTGGADRGLQDALKVHLETNRPDLLERRRALGGEGPDGALDVTYVRGGGNHPRVNRMDRIYTSSLGVVDVSTFYADSLTVGSDHALVIADLQLPEPAA